MKITVRSILSIFNVKVHLIKKNVKILVISIEYNHRNIKSLEVYLINNNRSINIKHFSYIGVMQHKCSDPHRLI